MLKNANVYSKMANQLSNFECDVIKNRITISYGLTSILFVINQQTTKDKIVNDVMKLLKAQFDMLGIQKTKNNTKWHNILENSSHDSTSKIKKNIWYDYVIDLEHTPEGMLVNPMSVTNFVALCEKLKHILGYAYNHNNRALAKIFDRIQATNNFIDSIKLN